MFHGELPASALQASRTAFRNESHWPAPAPAPATRTTFRELARATSANSSSGLGTFRRFVRGIGEPGQVGLREGSASRRELERREEGRHDRTIEPQLYVLCESSNRVGEVPRLLEALV